MDLLSFYLSLAEDYDQWQIKPVNAEWIKMMTVQVCWSERKEQGEKLGVDGFHLRTELIESILFVLIKNKERHKKKIESVWIFHFLPYF